MKRLFLALALTALSSTLTRADKLRINTDPPGATVEIDGITVGKTPYETNLPGGYFHGTRTVWGARLSHQMHLRLSLSGYLSKEIDMANGPMHWMALNGTYHGDYWVFKTNNFSFQLDKATETFTGSITANLSNGTPVVMRPELPLEEIVRATTPSVLVLRNSEGSGTGFLITDTGVAVTNAHVASGSGALTALSSTQQQIDAKVVYVDRNMDIALVKLEGKDFPYLKLADISNVPVGATAIAIGNPPNGLQNTVTKGVVSGIGSRADSPGTWIQTDAAINPGNSGGPLLNAQGEVIGITTMKEFLSSDGRPLQGIGFALSSRDLLAVLQRFYPAISAPQAVPPELGNAGTGRVTVSSATDGADIFVDGKFVGNAPSTLTLPSGSHKIEVKSPNSATWERDLEVMKDSDVQLKAAPKPQ
jgi:S1-C subfamily serine protease